MMRALTLSELQTPLQAELHGADVRIENVCTDSRQVAGGDLFVALKGERFDGHAYLAQVAEAGAGAALVSEVSGAALPQLQVADTEKALGHLGAYNRSLYQGPLVAITGSNGKTTAKTMLAAVLSQAGQTLATEGNYNNEIGVPLTLLRLAPEHRYAVVEMGAKRAGDIAWLCSLAQPKVSILLNAMPAHLEGFGSLEGVASAKGEIFDALGAGDCAVINIDQPYAAAWLERAAPADILRFGLGEGADVTASNVQNRGVAGIGFTLHTPAGSADVDLQLPGEHNVGNALAVAAAALACGIELNDIAAGLASARAPQGRLAQQHNGTGALIVDDCYNANPGSVKAAILLLAATEGRRHLIFGEMKELGENSVALHRQIGEAAAAAGLEGFWVVGEGAAAAAEGFGPGVRYFDNKESLIDALPGAFGEGDTVLVKASRGAALEVVVQALNEAGGQA